MERNEKLTGRAIVDAYDALEAIQNLILSTPTGPVRDQLCDAQIHLNATLTILNSLAYDGSLKLSR